MGRKSKKETLKPWCYYCDREFDNEGTLVQHQVAKHFKCSECHKKLSNVTGLVYHLFQVHKVAIESVPNARIDRGRTDLEIYGMTGVPEEAIKEREKEREKEGGTKKRKITNEQEQEESDLVTEVVPTFVPFSFQQAQPLQPVQQLIQFPPQPQGGLAGIASTPIPPLPVIPAGIQPLGIASTPVPPRPLLNIPPAPFGSVGISMPLQLQPSMSAPFMPVVPSPLMVVPASLPQQTVHSLYPSSMFAPVFSSALPVPAVPAPILTHTNYSAAPVISTATIPPVDANLAEDSAQQITNAPESKSIQQGQLSDLHKSVVSNEPNIIFIFDNDDESMEEMRSKKLDLTKVSSANAARMSDLQKLVR